MLIKIGTNKGITMQTFNELRSVQETYKQMILEVKEYSLKGWKADEIEDLDSELNDQGMENGVKISGPKGNKVMKITDKKLEPVVAKLMKPGGDFIAKNGKPHSY